MSFKEVVPGVSVNTDSGFKVSIPHPDPCWTICNPDKTATMSNSGSLLVFSDEEKGHNFMKGGSKDSYLLEKYDWDDLVDKFGGQYSRATVDHEGKAGFYSAVPLQKGI